MQTTVENIDSIDTKNMIVTLTINVKLMWYDRRLTFSNPHMNEVNLIPSETADLLWTPFRDLIHENAIIGEIIYVRNNIIKLHAQFPEDLDASKPIENRIFNGSYNALELSQRMKIRYNCIFDVKSFPFDGNHCDFIMKIDKRRESAIRFVHNGDIRYGGTPIIDQFSIGKMNETILNSKESTKYIFYIQMHRVFTSQLINTFLPTVILWLFGYATLFIDLDHPSDRFMGSGTALLVIATLINSIINDLPKTSYLKFIDLWLIWHFISIFAMIVCNVVVDRLKIGNTSKDEEKSSPVQVLPCNDETNEQKRKTSIIVNGRKVIRDIIEANWITSTSGDKLEIRNSTRKAKKMNAGLIILFPVVNSLFYGIYFYLTFTYHDDNLVA